MSSEWFFFLLLTNLSERGFPRPRGRNGSGTVQPGLFHGEGSKRYNIILIKTIQLNFTSSLKC